MENHRDLDIAEESYGCGVSLRVRFEDTGSIDDICQSIEALKRAVDLSPEDSPNLPTWLSDLGSSMWCLFEESGELPDLAEVISAHQRAISISSPGRSDLPDMLRNLGVALEARFEATGDLPDLAESIVANETAVTLSPEDHPNAPTVLQSLGAQLQSLFMETEDRVDINKAIAVQRKASQLTVEDHSYPMTILNDLAFSFFLRFERTGDMADLSEAITTQENAVRIAPKDHEHIPSLLNNLEMFLSSRFERTENLSDLSESISLKRRAVSLTREDYEHRHVILRSLATSLQSRYDLTGDLPDITEAISLQQDAIKLNPEDHPDILSDLGTSLKYRFERTSNFADLTEAISVKQKSVALIPEGHSVLPNILSSLGECYVAQFRCTGDLSDLSEAISVHREAVGLVSHGDAILPIITNNLALSLQYRFQHTGDLCDISEAISTLQRVVDITTNGDPKLATYLSNLGAAYQHRFDYSNDLDDIAEAVGLHQKAVTITPTDYADLLAWLGNLSASYGQRFNFTRDLPDVTAAISAQRRAVELTPEGYEALPTLLSNLGTLLASGFDSTRDLSHIAEAISLHQKAVSLTPVGHGSLHTRFNNLGLALQSRFEYTGDMTDLTEAISAKEKAVDVTPDGNAHLPIRLQNLAWSLYARFEATGSHDDLDKSIAIARRSATCASGSPRSRVSSSTFWALTLYHHYPDAPDVMSAFDAALNSVTLLAGLDQTLRRRYARLQDGSTVTLSPVKAAAAALDLGRTEKAVEWLEQGRCLVWNQVSVLRTQADDLREHDAELARQFTNLAERLEKAGASQNRSRGDMSLSEKISSEGEADAHLKLSRDWDILLARVRALPGFESFLQRSSCSALLRHLPTAGPIVLINVDESRCDALVLLIGQERPLHIPLPDFSLKMAKEYHSRLVRQLGTHNLRGREGNGDSDESAPDRGLGLYRRKRGVDGSITHDILRGLWTGLVKPILDSLKFQKSDQASETLRPRVWWCPTGPLTFLPIHAAGIYEGMETECTLDYVVSSYTPSVGALTSRLTNDHPIDQGLSGLFLKSQPKVPGAFTIPGTTEEVNSIYGTGQAIGVRVSKVEGDSLTVDGCLQSMEEFSSIHLACHASQSSDDPLQSRFHFQKGSLELETIIQRNLRNADVAFLSACQTSSGHESLSDEAVHLAAGMLAAGYRRVIATMWMISDRHAPGVAKNFYEYLWSRRKEGSGSGFDGSLSAHALHHSIQQLREQLDNSEKSLLTWAAYVHYGY